MNEQIANLVEENIKLKERIEKYESVERYNDKIMQSGTDRTGYITPEEWERRKKNDS